jgi:hypothetical protein
LGLIAVMTVDDAASTVHVSVNQATSMHLLPVCLLAPCRVTRLADITQTQQRAWVLADQRQSELTFAAGV